MRLSIDRDAAAVIARTDPAVSPFLAEYLLPFFSERRVGMSWSVSWSRHEPGELDDRFDDAEPSGEPSSGEALSSSWTEVSAGRWIARHRDSQAAPWTVLELDDSARTLHVNLAAGTSTDQYAVARAIRSLLVSLACTHTWSQLHGAAFVVDGQAVLVIGEKGAGKTGFLLTALASGADFMSNDRVLCMPDGGGVVVHGLPHSVTVRAGTAAAEIMTRVPSTYGDRQPSNGLQLRYHVKDVVEATGSAIVPRAPLKLVVAPRVQPGPVEVERLSGAPALELLEQAARPSTSSFEPFWDAWRPHRQVAWPWPAAEGLLVGYDPDDIGDAVRRVSEEAAR